MKTENRKKLPVIPSKDQSDEAIEEFFREEEELERELAEVDDDDSNIEEYFTNHGTDVRVLSPQSPQDYSAAITGKAKQCPTCGCIVPEGALRCENCGEALAAGYTHEKTIFSGRQAFRHCFFWGIIHFIKAALIGVLTAIPIGIIYILVAQTIGIHKFNAVLWGILILSAWIGFFLAKSLIGDLLSWLVDSNQITTKRIIYRKGVINIYTQDIPISRVTRIVAHQNILDFLLCTCNVYVWSADGSIANLKGLPGGKRLREELSALNALIARY